MSKLITANCDGIVGHTRFGHWELNLTDAEYEDFNNLPEDEQIQYLKDEGSLIIDDYDIDDYEEPTNIQIHDV